jgi:hypothetical protein
MSANFDQPFGELDSKRNFRTSDGNILFQSTCLLKVSIRLAWRDCALANHPVYGIRQVVEPLQQTACVIETLRLFCIVGTRHLSQDYNHV